jgi:aspartate oxidase
LVARAASLRRESRGVHHRTDHPDPDPAWAGVRLRLTRK